MALKLLAVVDRHPRVKMVKIVFHTSGKGAEEFAYLELRSTAIPEGVSAANLYALSSCRSQLSSRNR